MRTSAFAEVVSKVLLLAADESIQDPGIRAQIQAAVGNSSTSKG